MKAISSLMCVLIFLIACGNTLPSNEVLHDSCLTAFEKYPSYQSDGFDFPVGKPDGKGYYKAQEFGENFHLGEDWNGVGGGNTDLGDPIFSISHGIVVEAKKQTIGWGNVIRVLHCHQGKAVESLYAHCDTMLVKQGDWVKRGQKIAEIGTADGMYKAHLHLEIRHQTDMKLGGGYSKDTTGFLTPTEFIESNRPVTK